MQSLVGKKKDATDIEHDTEEGPGEDTTVREEEGRNGIDTKEEPVEILLTQKDLGVNYHTR